MSGGCDRVLVCGGGIHNKALLQKLEQRLGIPLASTASVGVEPDWLEAMAFAWMARCHLRRDDSDEARKYLEKVAATDVRYEKKPQAIELLQKIA